MYGDQAIEELVKVSGAGLRAGGDGLSAGGGRTLVQKLKKQVKEADEVLDEETLDEFLKCTYTKQ